MSLRLNFAWSLAGNVVYAMCQWGMIVALAKLGNAAMIGQYSLGLAIATPVIMLSNSGLRSTQATDCRRQYRFAEYLGMRIMMTLAALGVILVIVWRGRYEAQTGTIILVVALAKAVETLSDIHYGLFQLNDRLDHTGISMMLRGVAAVAAFGIALYWTHNVLWACIWTTVNWLVVLFLFDIRRGRLLVGQTESADPGAPADRPRRQWDLFRLAAPLGIVTTIAALNLYMPRYFIHAWMGEHQLGIFSALAYTTTGLTVVGDSLAQSAIPPLSRLYAAGSMAVFRSLLFRLSAAGLAFGLAGVAIAQGMGKWLMGVFYGSEYARSSHAFVLLMGAAGINFVASVLTGGITSARYFRIQVPLYALVVGFTVIGCRYWIPTMGLVGAAFAVIAGASVRLVLAANILWFVLFAPGRVQRGRGFGL